MSIARFAALLVLLGPLLAQEMPRARLEGQTTDAVQRPLANCAITVEVDGEVLAKSNSDATGFFIVGALPQRRVVVRAVAGADVGAVEVDLAGVDSGFAHVRLYPARTVRGVVHRADGPPVAGAWIVAAPNDARELAVIDACAQSGADGRYEMRHVLAGPVTVRAWAQGLDLFEETIDGADDAELDCELDDFPWREIRFVLQDATTEQLANARLRLRAESHSANLPVPLPPPLRAMRPDAGGVCVVRGWSTHDRLIGWFSMTGAVVVPPRTLVPKGPRQWKCTYSAQPTDSSSIRGVLRDLQGVPLVDKVVLCRPLPDDEAGIGTRFVHTGADGTFAVPAPVAPGERFALRVVDPGWAVAHEASRLNGSRSWYVAEYEEDAEHSVPVGNAVPLHLRVVDPEGVPVRGADAVVRASTGRGLAVLGSGSSDASGRIELHGIDLTMVHKIQLTLRSAEGVATCERDLTTGKSGDLGRVALTPAAALVGRVVATTGKPVVGARVRLGSELVLTGRDGRFAITGMPAGIYELSVTAGGDTWIRERQVVRLTGGETAEQFIEQAR